MDTKTLEKLQRIYDQVDTFGKSLMEKEFPGIKDFEGERIRKFLIEKFTGQYLCKDKSGTWHGEPVINILAWLEKQGKENTELPSGEDYGIDSLYHALRILQTTLGEVEGYQSDDGILEHECAISAVEKLYTQIKWTEEDEHAMKQIIACLRGQTNSDLPAMTNWIKSIKQRFMIQTEESD